MAKMRFKALFACLLLLSASASYSWSFSGAASQTWAALTAPKVLLTALAAVSFGFNQLCRYMSSPNNPKEITLEMLKVATIVPDDNNFELIKHTNGLSPILKNKEVIALFCPGFAPLKHNVGQRSGKLMMQAGAIPLNIQRDRLNTLPCITFDFLDNANSFNYGQNLDQRCFNVVYDAIVALNPNAKIIVYGLCRGALVVHNTLCNTPENQPERYKNIKAVVLDELPNIDIKTIPMYITLADYGKYKILPWNVRMHPKIYDLLFVNIKRNQKENNLRKFPAHIPVFIGNITQDPTCSTIDASIDRLQKMQLRNLYTYTCPNPNMRHGDLIGDKEYVNNLNLFYKKFGLPHNLAHVQPNDTVQKIDKLHKIPLDNRD